MSIGEQIDNLKHGIDDVYFASYNRGYSEGEEDGYINGSIDTEQAYEPLVEELNKQSERIQNAEEQLYNIARTQAELIGEEAPEPPPLGLEDDVRRIADNNQRVYEAGEEAEYNRFWDIYQDYGNRQSYMYSFYGSGWTEKTFKPKYDMVLSGRCDYMMAFAKLEAPFEIMADRGLQFDLSQVTNATGMFNQTAYLKRLGDLNFKNVTNLIYLDALFYNCTNLETVKSIFFNETVRNQNSFVNCKSLKNIKVTGIIGYDFFIQYSPLSKESIISIINALSDNVSGKTLTLKSTAVNNAFGSSTSQEWLELINTKPNWTISLG